MLLILMAVAVGAAVVVGALVVGALFLSGARVEPIATKVVEQPGFDGELSGRWRQRRGGFTGDEARLPSDAALTEKWPPGSVVELLLKPGGAYRFTSVEASGTGVLATKALVRDEGRWTADGHTLTLTVEAGVTVKRVSADRTATSRAPAGPQRYALSSLLKESPGTPGASPAVTTGLRLRGPCLSGPGGCTFDLELVDDQ